MRLCYRHRPHRFDWLASMQGTRLLVLDVWIDATPDEVGKMKSFNMLKQDFIETNKPRGMASIVTTVIGALGTWYAWYNFEPMTIAIWAGITAFSLWSMKVNVGKSTRGMVKVAQLLASTPLPFTRDNAADIHQVVTAVEERYQILFGAMFEIEHFEVTREATWREEVAS